MDNLFAPSIIAFLTFLLGLLGTAVTYLFSLYHKRNSIRLTVISWLETNKAGISKYSEFLQKLYTDIKEADKIEPINYETNRISIDRINEFTINELNDALVQNLSGDEKKSEKSTILFNLLRNIEFMGDLQSFVSERYGDYVKYMNQEGEKLETGFHAFLNYMASTRFITLSDNDKNLLQEIDKFGIYHFGFQFNKDNCRLKLSTLKQFTEGINNILVTTKNRGVVYDNILIISGSILSPYKKLKGIQEDSYSIFLQCFEKFVGSNNEQDEKDSEEGLIKKIEDCVEFYKNRKIKFFPF